jgi:hypothetical protein
MRRKCCRPRREEEERARFVFWFRAFVVVHTIIFALVLVGVVYALDSADVFWFLPFDLQSIVIAVIIFDLIIGISGYAAAGSDVTFLWIWFHLVVGILLVVEIGTSWLSSDIEGFINIAHETWGATGDDGIVDLETGWGCCGFDNITDRPQTIGNCSYAECCREKLGESMELIRDAASIVMFVDFILVTFMDFAGCAICFHPTALPINPPRGARDCESEGRARPFEEDKSLVP